MPARNRKPYGDPRRCLPSPPTPEPLFLSDRDVNHEQNNSRRVSDRSRSPLRDPRRHNESTTQSNGAGRSKYNKSERYATNVTRKLDRYVPPFARGHNSSRSRSKDIVHSTAAGNRESTSCSKSTEDNRMENETADGSQFSQTANPLTMPKNFKQPLTCFYWATQGRCNKSDENCWYCHYYTGFVAAAPVKIAGSSAVAGRHVENRVLTATQKEEILEVRRNKLNAREQDVKYNEEAVNQSVDNLKMSISRTLEALDNLSSTSRHARNNIGAHTDIIEDSLNKNGTSFEQTSFMLMDSGKAIIRDANKLVEAIKDSEVDFKAILTHIYTHVGSRSTERD